MPIDNDPRVLRARSLEQSGQHDAAARLYFEAGQLPDAARMMMAAARFIEAARILLLALGDDVHRLTAVGPVPRKHALTAAICFHRGGDLPRAVELFTALGEWSRAIDALERAGDAAGAQRIREQLLRRTLGAQAVPAAPGTQTAAGPMGAGAMAVGAATAGPVTAPPAAANLVAPGAGLAIGAPPAASAAAAPPHAPFPSVNAPPITPAAAINRSRIENARALETAGQLAQALEAYVALLHYADAARVARKLGALDRAGELYLDAGEALEAAACFQSLGDPAKQLDALVRVPRDDARYRDAALAAIELASTLNVIDFRLEQFLTRWMANAPENTRELAALIALGRLYLRHSFLENAREAFSKVVAKDPDHKDALAQLAGIDAELRASPMVYDRILREDVSFQRAGNTLVRGAPGSSSGLPELPPLPPLPVHTVRAAPPPAPAERTVHEPSLGQRTLFDPMPELLPQGRVAPARSDPSIAPPPPPNSSPPPPPSSMPPGPGPERGSATLLSPATVGVTISRPPEPPRTSLPPLPHIPPPVKDSFPPLADIGFVEGAVIADRYELRQKIGRGGMAVVWRARDLELGGTRIAMKVITQPLDDNAEQLRRFKQELLLSRQLNHPNILRLYDIGTHRGYRYITMELLKGRDLKSMMGRPIEFARGLDLLLQALEGLQAVHDSGIVHRDVKPHNFFITTDDQLKIMDFGIAKTMGTEGHTIAGTIAGTPNYMSPEQINGFERVTTSTDIYSMGVIAYEMFTGQLPFTSSEMMQVLMMHLKDAPLAPRERNPFIPEPLEKLILRLLEKKAENRYPSCRAIAEELKRIRSSFTSATIEIHVEDGGLDKS